MVKKKFKIPQLSGLDLTKLLPQSSIENQYPDFIEYFDYLSTKQLFQNQTSYQIQGSLKLI